MKLSDVNKLSASQIVTVLIKIIDVAAPEKAKPKEGKELCKQECKICDESGCVRLVLWGMILEELKKEEVTD